MLKPEPLNESPVCTYSLLDPNVCFLRGKVSVVTQSNINGGYRGLVVLLRPSARVCVRFDS